MLIDLVLAANFTTAKWPQPLIDLARLKTLFQHFDHDIDFAST